MLLRGKARPKRPGLPRVREPALLRCCSCYRSGGRGRATVIQPGTGIARCHDLEELSGLLRRQCAGDFVGLEKVAGCRHACPAKYRRDRKGPATADRPRHLPGMHGAATVTSLQRLRAVLGRQCRKREGKDENPTGGTIEKAASRAAFTDSVLRIRDYDVRYVVTGRSFSNTSDSFPETALSMSAIRASISDDLQVLSAIGLEVFA